MFRAAAAVMPASRVGSSAETLRSLTSARIAFASAEPSVKSLSAVSSESEESTAQAGIAAAVSKKSAEKRPYARSMSRQTSACRTSTYMR